MSKKLSDEQLLKRAGHLARNLYVIACLSLIVSIAMGGLVVAGKAPLLVAPIFVGILLATVAFFVLAVGAGRGEHLGGTVVTVTYAVHAAITFIATSVMMGSGKSSSGGTIGGFLVPILVIIALWQSREVILEIKRRDLFEQAFGGKRSGRTVTIVGLCFFFLAYFTAVGGGFVSGAALGVEMAKANRRYIQIMNNDYAAVKSAMKALQKDNSDEAYQRLEQSLETLEKVFVQFDKATEEETLSAVSSKQARAVRLWREGFVLVRQGDTEDKKGMRKLKMGDQLFNEALKQYSEFIDVHKKK